MVLGSTARAFTPASARRGRRSDGALHERIDRGLIRLDGRIVSYCVQGGVASLGNVLRAQVGENLRFRFVEGQFSRGSTSIEANEMPAERRRHRLADLTHLLQCEG